MKVLIVSDTHGHMTNLRECVRRVSPIDMLIHCGDTEGGEDWIRQHTQCLSVPIVKGNNDFFSRLPAELELDIEGLHIFLTHGHAYGVSMGTERPVEEALSRKADVVMYGHTHRPMIMREGRLWVINPGSLSYPRQEGHDPTYIVMNCENGKEPDFTLYKLSRDS